MINKLSGLVAATHTPFHADYSLNLDAIETQAAHLRASGVGTVFIGGTTGESHSLSLVERIELTERWMQVARGSDLRVIVHVGANCLEDARALAAQAEKLGARAISALAPSYFKPRSIEALIASAAHVAAAAPETPFYLYDIPTMTGVNLSMPDFLDQAPSRIPTLVGLKFSNSDLLAYQLCLHANGGAWDMPWGFDEVLLGALAVGATSAVGSSYNFAAPIYLRLMSAFAEGDLATAREEQFRSVRLIQLVASYGYMSAAKSIMTMLGVPVGLARLPHTGLPADQVSMLRAELEALGFFDWIRR